MWVHGLLVALVGWMTYVFFTIEAEGRTIRSAVTCPKPKVENGQIFDDKEEYVPGDVEYINCDYAYRLLGKDRLRCNNDGTWSTNPPYCQIVKCHRPLEIMNGSIEVKEPAVIQTVATFHCNQGFVLVGPHSLECGINGEWIPYSTPQCKEVRCPKLPEIRGLKYKKQPSLGGYVESECDEGFARMQGKAVLHCDNNGTWVPNEMPYCEFITTKGNTNRYMIGFYVLFGVLIITVVVIVILTLVICKHWIRKHQNPRTEKQSGGDKMESVKPAETVELMDDC